MKRRMVFDVESIGLHGDAWAVGYVVLEGKDTVDEGWAWCDPEVAHGTMEGRAWIAENCPWGSAGLSAALQQEHGLPAGVQRRSPARVRDWFWEIWNRQERARGTELWADVPWPVEARFLAECVEDDREWSHDVLPSMFRAVRSGEGGLHMPPTDREPQGPYPLFDVRTLVEAAMICLNDRAVPALSEDDLPSGPVLVHHPLADARLSASKLLRVEHLLQRLV